MATSGADPAGEGRRDSELAERVLFRFSKLPELRFVGHLDLMRLLERGMRRSGFPVQYSQGFNPRPRMSLASALTAGATSECELCQVDLAQPAPAARMAIELNRLGDCLPRGLHIQQWWSIPLERRNPYIQVTAAEYRLELSRRPQPEESDPAAAILQFLSTHQAMAAAKDLRAANAEYPDGSKIELFLTLPVGGRGGLRIREVVSAIEEALPGTELTGLHRVRLWCESEPESTPDEELHGEMPAEPA